MAHLKDIATTVQPVKLWLRFLKEPLHTNFMNALKTQSVLEFSRGVDEILNLPVNFSVMFSGVFAWSETEEGNEYWQLVTFAARDVMFGNVNNMHVLDRFNLTIDDEICEIDLSDI